MKKALVLAMALAASATFAVTVNLMVDGAAWDGTSSIDIGSALQVSYTTTGISNDSGFGNMGKTVGIDNAVLGSIVIGTGDVSWSLAPSGWSVVSDGVNGVNINDVYGVMAPAQAGTAGTVMTIDFNAAVEGQLNVSTSLLSNPDGVAPETLSATVVPEPMTMALLGLGGMLIRRKK
jgi:hypothetical protein